jgi:hypothetical protein
MVALAPFIIDAAIFWASIIVGAVTYYYGG